MDRSWQGGMAAAYEAGRTDAALFHRDGTQGVAQPERGGGFYACYWQGFGQGLGACRCPERLAGNRWGQRCVVCGNRRHP
jgi:hypothetical protein